MKIIELSEVSKKLDLIISLLNSGGIILYPTDTVYGIGCDATNRQAIDRIYKIKKRPVGKPMSVAFSDFQMMQKYAKVDGFLLSEMRGKLPGPYTFIVPARNLPDTITKDGKVGVRIPRLPELLRLISEFGKPIITTSANLTDRAPVSLLDSVDYLVKTSVGLIIKDDSAGSGIPSTVIDPTTGDVIR